MDPVMIGPLGDRDFLAHFTSEAPPPAGLPRCVGKSGRT